MSLDLSSSTARVQIGSLERYRPIVDDWNAFLDTLARPLPVCIWTNTLRISADRLTFFLDRENLPFHRLAWYDKAFKLPPDVNPGNNLPYVTGLFHVQEEVSMIPALLLDPQPGERILDLCAAPGNKTAQIAVAMNNRGTLVANDLSEIRLRVLKTTLSRLGLVNTTVTVGDAASFTANIQFDRVLVDAPCSCEGTSRKHPSALLHAGPEQSRQLSQIQYAILERAVHLCRPGGRIVYATCTYAPEENEQVVARVLHTFHGRLKLKPARIEGFVSSKGLTEWNNIRFGESMSSTMRIWPHQNDTGGFFVAVLEKKPI